jgi:DeoR family galactitol utilization operon repressor
MTANMTIREKEIIRYLAEDEGVSVAELSRRLGVSEVTIRTNLGQLEAKGLIVRHKRGGAVPAFHQHILSRQKSMVEEKERIAKAAAALIEEGDHIMLVAGTTTALVARHLLGKRDIHIVTNSTLLLSHVRINPSIRVTLIGGEFRPSMEGMVGPLAVTEIRQFHVKYAFIGTDGFSTAGGVTAHHIEEAEMVKAVAGQTDKLVLVADSTKYGKQGFALMFPLKRLDLLITDNGLPETARQELREAGLQLMTV